MTPCWDFKQNNCSRGDACRYSHEDPSAERRGRGERDSEDEEAEDSEPGHRGRRGGALVEGEEGEGQFEEQGGPEQEAEGRGMDSETQYLGNRAGKVYKKKRKPKQDRSAPEEITSQRPVSRYRQVSE